MSPLKDTSPEEESAGKAGARVTVLPAPCRTTSSVCVSVLLIETTMGPREEFIITRPNGGKYIWHCEEREKLRAQKEKAERRVQAWLFAC